jgi:excisionase family DNA binding protein
MSKSNGRATIEVTDPLLTPQEVADLCRKHVDTIRRWANDGLLKAVRMPTGLYMFRKSEVVKLLGASAFNITVE